MNKEKYSGDSESTKWRMKITKYYARWYTQHIKKLVCSKFALKNVTLETRGNWSSAKSSFTIETNKLPITSAFLGAKQLQEYVLLLTSFFDTSDSFPNRDMDMETKVQHIYVYVHSNSADKEGGFDTYTGLLVPSVTSTGVVFKVHNLWHSSVEEKEVLTSASVLSEWLLKYEISSCDMAVTFSLDIPFLKY